MLVQKSLDLFAKRVKQQALSNLSKQQKNNTKELYRSISYEVKEHKNSFTLSFKMSDYGKYVDKGVKGKTSFSKAPNSPFRFGSGNGVKGGLTSGILKWVIQKRIQFKNVKTGKFFSYENTAFLITRSVYTKGISPTHFFSRPFENEFKKLPKEIVESYGLNVFSLIKSALKK
jgi:hypothetical protein